MIAEARWAERDHAIAETETFDTGADTDHDTGAFKAESRSGKAVFHRLLGEQAQRIHDVAEIEARGGHFDFDFIGGRTPVPERLPAQIAQLAGKLAPHTQGGGHQRV